MKYKLSLIDSICDSGFYKAIEGYFFTNDTIQSVKSAYMQISGAILSASKQAIYLSYLTDLYSMISF